MATQLKMHTKGEEDDDEDVEALRLAALKTLRPKPAPIPFCPPPVSTIVYHSHRRHPNLITIVPVGSNPDPVFKPPPRVVTNPLAKFKSHSVIPIRTNQVSNNTYLKSNEPIVETKEKTEEEEEVSTKFSRFEDSKSESEDDSDTDDKGSESSEESDADCIALQDDDSLEALMAQMEQEFGEGNETKVEKKKNKSSGKNKNKSNITKSEEKKSETVKVEQKTAVSESVCQEVKPKSQPKTVPPLKVEVKPMKRSPVRSLSPVRTSSTASPLLQRSPVKLAVQTVIPLRSPPIEKSPYRSKSPVRQRSPIKLSVKKNSPVRSPQRQISPYRPKSPVRQRSPLRIKSPVKSPIHSPLRSKSPRSPLRSKSPRSPLRSKSPRSPLRSKSPIHSSRLKSPLQTKIWSPPRQKSPLRSPVKQKSPLRLSPLRRSRSPLRPYSPIGKYSVHRKSPIRRSPSPYGRLRRSRSPLRKRSLSPFVRKERGFLPRSKDRSPKYSPNYYSKTPSPRRGRRSPTPPPKKWTSPRRRSPSPVRYRSPNQIRRSPRRVYSRSPSPAYYSPRRRSPSPVKKKVVLRRRSLSPSPTPRRSLSPRRRSVSPKRANFSPLRRPFSPKIDNVTSKRSISPRRKLTPPNKLKKYSPVPRSPVRRQHSMSPQRRTPPLRRKVNSPQRQKYERVWNKNERPKSDTDTKPNNWSRSSSVSLSPSPQPRDIIQAEESSRRHKSPLRIQKGSVANSYYNKSDKRPISPNSRNGSGDRRRAGRNWKRGGKSWEGRKTDRDRRREKGVDLRFKKKVPKIDKPNTFDENEVQTFPQKTDNPILEARRKKFESNDLVEPASKKIRLRNSPVREKAIESVEVQTEPEEVVSKPETDDLNIDVEDDILDLGAELWSSDEGEPLVKRNGNTSRKVIRATSPKKRKPVKERITLEGKVHKPKRKQSTTTSMSTEMRVVDMKDTASSPLTVVQKENQDLEGEKSEKNTSPGDRGTKDEMDSDLRAELSRRRAERLTKAGSVHKNLPARIVQSAFEGVMGKKKVKRTEKKEKESKSKERAKKSPSPVQDVPKVTEKSDGRRVLVLKRTAPVRLPSQTAINVTFSEGNRDTSDSDSDENFVLPIKRKLPIHMRLGVPEERRRPHKARKVKLKHKNQV